MPNQSPRHGQVFGGFFQRDESVFESQLFKIKVFAERLDSVIGIFESLLDISFNGAGDERGPADLEIFLEERMDIFGHAETVAIPHDS